MQDWQEWFRQHKGKTVDIHQVIGGESKNAYRTEEISIGELYQMFKSRIIFELGYEGLQSRP